MSTQIAFFNHKGGVAKTTTAFNVGWMLASTGHRVLLVDCDPQCNLTGLILAYESHEEYAFESDETVLNIRDGLEPAFKARPVPLEPVQVQAVPQCENLFVLPGHVGFAEYESQLSIAHDLSGSLAALQNIPGAMRHLFDLTAQSINAEFVIVDMSPSLGAINQNIWATSDAFVIPMAPDYFSAMALRSLASVLPKWHDWSRRASTHEGLSEASYPWPSKTPKYLGSVVQNYRVRSRDGKPAAPTKAYQMWFDALTSAKAETLIPALQNSDLLLEIGKYENSGAPIDKFLLEIPDFNSLIAVSQNLSKPVFTLTQDEIKTGGSVAANQLASVAAFEAKYREGAEKIAALLTDAVEDPDS